MPILNGIETCRAVKENPFTGHIPVLMLTALGAVERKLEGVRGGAPRRLPREALRHPRAARAGGRDAPPREGETDRNPTSGLPGGRAVEDELRRRVAAGKSFAVCYIDLDNFKPFADTFGFATADRVIRETGRALREAAAETGGGDAGDFVGHIGGDDFIVVTREDRGSLSPRRAR